MTAGGHYLALGSLAAARRLEEGSGEIDFYNARISIARFYATNILPLVHGLKQPCMAGAGDLFAVKPEHLAL